MESFNGNDKTLEEGEIDEEYLDDGHLEIDRTRKGENAGQNRKWPLTFLHFKGEQASSIRSLPAGVTSVTSYPSPRCKTIKVVREPRERVRPKFVRRFRYRQSAQRHPIARNKDSRDQFSYEDLLSQYRDIQSQLEELKQEEDSARNEKGKDGKENVKSSKRRSSITIRHNSSRSRRHARSRSKSNANDSSKSPQIRSDEEEDEDVQELRRIALASAKDKAKVKRSSGTKKSPERRLSFCKPCDVQLSSADVESLQNDKSQIMQPHLYDNYEQVAMELDSNYSGGEEEDEEHLRSTLLLSLNQKKNNHVIPVETTVIVPSKIQEKETKKSPPSIMHMTPPVHEPVVINLGEDSTDSESESECRQTLKTSDTPKVTIIENKVLKIGTVPVQTRISTKLVNDAKSERHLKLLRILKRDSQEINQLKTTLNKKRALHLEAEKKAKQLSEQLAAANKIVVATQASIVKISNQIKVAQARAADRRAQVKKVFLRENILANKSTVVLRNQVTNQASMKKQRSQQIAEEKKLLLKREQEIAAQLRLLQKLNKVPTRQVIAPGTILPMKIEIENNIIAQTDASPPQSKPNNITGQKINTQQELEKCVSVITVAAPHNLDLFPLPWSNDVKVPLHLSNTGDGDSMPSPLSHFKAFRLSKCFDRKFTSSTYANKIDPYWTLCSFDLRGTCNDDQCPWQHSSHYTLTPEETLVDLALYAPSVLGVNPNSEQVQNELTEKVKPLLKKAANLEEGCLKLAEEIRQGNNNMILDRRKFVSQKDRKTTKANHSLIKEFTADNDYMDADVDDNQRYFSHATQTTEDLENILKADPTNIDLWLQLAELTYKKRVRSSSKGIDRTLHILSRALESNRNNEKLWLKYLSIYGHHPKNEDFVDLCRQAFEFAPSYEIGELYLRSSVDKFEVCDCLWRFLENNSFSNTKELSSTRALQLLLRQTQLHMENNVQDGIRFLQEYLKGDSRLLLLPHHTAFAWLVVIHVAAFSSLPFNLFSGFLTLAFDSPFVITWNNVTSPKKLLPIFKDAIYNSNLWNSPKDAFVIYWNLIELYMHCKDWNSANNECHNATLKFPNLIDPVILNLKLIYMQSSKTELLEAAKTAIVQHKYSCRLRFVAALIAFKCESVELALQMLCTFSKELCGETMLEPSCCYKNILNLNQTLKIGKTKPSSVVDTNDLVYVWLSFSLFLFLGGRDPSDLMDTALVRTVCQQQRILIWSFYLRMKSNKDTSTWLHLIWRCLNSIDTIHQMDLVDTISGFLPDEGRLNFLDTFHDWMPNNSHILLRYLQLLTAKGDDTTATFVCRDAEVAALSLEAALLSIQSASRVLPAHQKLVR